MSKKEKLVLRFLSRPKDFSYSELVLLLRLFGYVEITTGKTSGSRRAFSNSSSGHIIRLHKPHPEEDLKIYQVDLIIDELKKLKIL